MNELWQVLLLSLLPGTGNFAGGVIAEFWKPSPVVEAMMWTSINVRR